MKWFRRTIDDYGPIPDPHARRKAHRLALMTSINLVKSVENLNKSYAKMSDTLNEAARKLKKLGKELEKNADQ